MVDYSDYTSVSRPDILHYADSHIVIMFMILYIATVSLIPMLLVLSSMIIIPLKIREILYNIVFLTSVFYLAIVFNNSSVAILISGTIVIMLFNIVLAIKNKYSRKIILFYFSPMIYFTLVYLAVAFSHLYFLLGVTLYQPLGYVFFLKPKMSNYIIQGFFLTISLTLAFALKWVGTPEGLFGIVYPYKQIDPMLFSTVFIDIWLLCLLCHIIMYVVTFFRLVSTEKRKISELNQNDDISIDSTI